MYRLCSNLHKITLDSTTKRSSAMLTPHNKNAPAAARTWTRYGGARIKLCGKGAVSRSWIG